MGLIGETAGVFEFLRECFSALPVAVKLLVYGSFGGVIFIALMKSIRR